VGVRYRLVDIIGILGGLVGKILFHEIWGDLKQIMEKEKEN